MKKDKIPDRIIQLGQYLFGLGSPEDTIKTLSDFLRSIGCPVTLGEAGIAAAQRNLIIASLERNKASGYVFPLGREHYEQLVDFMTDDQNLYEAPPGERLMASTLLDKCEKRPPNIRSPFYPKAINSRF